MECSSKFHSHLSENFKMLITQNFAPPLPALLLLSLHPNNKATLSQTPLQYAIRLRDAQDVHWIMGLELRILFLNSPLPLCLWQSKDAPSIDSFASFRLLIRRTWRTPAAAPIVTCCTQHFSLSWHCHDGCIDVGLLVRSIGGQCLECIGRTKRSSSSLQCCARIALLVFLCSRCCRWGFP